MLVAKCIKKEKNNNGKITGYILQDVTGQTMKVTGQQIKDAIQAGEIQITNLQIDKAGRLVDKVEDKMKDKIYNIPHTLEEANAWLERVGVNDLRMAKQGYKNNGLYGIYNVKNHRVLITCTSLEALCLSVDYASKNDKANRIFGTCEKLPHKDWINDEEYKREGIGRHKEYMYYNEELEIFVHGTPNGMYGILNKYNTQESSIYCTRNDNSVHVETFAKYNRTGGYAYAVCDADGNKKKESLLKNGHTVKKEDGIETNMYIPVEVGDYYIEYDSSTSNRVNISKITSIKEPHINIKTYMYNCDETLLDLDTVREEFGNLAPVIEYVYKKAFDPELKINPYAILK